MFELYIEVTLREFTGCARVRETLERESVMKTQWPGVAVLIYIMS